MVNLRSSNIYNIQILSWVPGEGKVEENWVSKTKMKLGEKEGEEKSMQVKNFILKFERNIFVIYEIGIKLNRVLG